MGWDGSVKTLKSKRPLPNLTVIVINFEFCYTFACTQLIQQRSQDELHQCVFIMLCSDITDGIILWSDINPEHLPTFIITPLFLPHSTIIHGMGWNVSPKKCNTIFFFFSITMLKSNPLILEHITDAWAGDSKQIFSMACQSLQMWCFVILQLAVPRYSTQNTQK